MNIERILIFKAVLFLVSHTTLGQVNNNELHAIFIQKNKFTSSDLNNPDSRRTFENINISSDFAPQNEPSVAISKVDPDIVVAAWRDFRLGYLEPDVVRRIGYSFSADGGITWAESQLLPDPMPDHISQSDPVVVSDMDGNFYISSTSRQPVSGYNREMLLYKSTDNGQTFGLHSIAVPGSGLDGEDKEWIYVDPFPENPTYNRLMIAWRSFGPSYGIKFRKSDVGGANWSETVNVGDVSSGQGANLTTGDDGRVLVVWAYNGIRYDISYDGGNSFGTDRTLTDYSYNINNSFPFVCSDHSDRPTRGNIYIVWSDTRLNYDDVWFQRSVDGGETWLSQPIRVNGVISYSQFWPAIQCDSDGRLFVTYYDESPGNGLMNAMIAYSEDAGDTWNEQILNTESFPGNAPNYNVRFGDYIEIDVFQGKIIPVWTDDRLGNFNQEILTAIVDIVATTSEPLPGSPISILNYPNPFSGATTIDFTLSEGSLVTADIFDSFGRRVEQLLSRHLPRGKHTFRWDTGLPAGIYHLVISNNESFQQYKLVKTR